MLTEYFDFICSYLGIGLIPVLLIIIIVVLILKGVK